VIGLLGNEAKPNILKRTIETFVPVAPQHCSFQLQYGYGEEITNPEVVTGNADFQAAHHLTLPR
jgi:hypothetical protein